MNTATTTCTTDASTTICTTNTAEYFVGGFSYGDVMIIFILMMLFIVEYFKILIKK
jgi:hypothetical protein